MEICFFLSTVSHLKPSFRLIYDLLCVHLWASHRLLSDCTDCTKLAFYRMTALWCRCTLSLNKAETLLCSFYIKIQYMLIHSAKETTLLFPSKIRTIWYRKTNSERWKTHHSFHVGHVGRRYHGLDHKLMLAFFIWIVVKRLQHNWNTRWQQWYSSSRLQNIFSNFFLLTLNFIGVMKVYCTVLYTTKTTDILYCTR